MIDYVVTSIAETPLVDVFEHVGTVEKPEYED